MPRHNRSQPQESPHDAPPAFPAEPVHGPFHGPVHEPAQVQEPVQEDIPPAMPPPVAPTLSPPAGTPPTFGPPAPEPLPGPGPHGPTPGDWHELWKAAGSRGPQLYAFTRGVVESLTGLPPRGAEPRDAPHLDLYLVRGVAEYLKLLKP